MIRYYHEENYHDGAQKLLATVRCKYWILQERNQVRKEIMKCVKCFRSKPKSCDQLMRQLLQVRVQVSATFLHTGVDYCGPLFLKVSQEWLTFLLSLAWQLGVFI
jgi:hypothetical protein